MIPGVFDYKRPATLADALSALKSGGDDGLLLAGGHSLVPMMKLRLAQPSVVIDLSGVPELRGIKTGKGGIVIGAMTSQHEIIASAELARACPILAATAKQIADPQVRYCGTIGGNAANGDPGNDMPAVLMALNAVYVLHGGGGERKVAAREYYQGAYFTARENDEILTAIHIPTPADGHGFAYEKQKRKIGDYATAAAAVVLSFSGGKIGDAAVALTNLADTPLLVEDAAKHLNGSDGGDDAIDKAVEACRAVCSPAHDQRGPADFRVYVAGILVGRAIRSAMQAAKK